MKTKLPFLLLVFGLLGIGVAVIALPALARSTNCGGNSAALSNVRHYVLLAQLSVMENPDKVFRITSVSAEQRAELSGLGRSHWIQKARFLVSTNPLSEQEFKARRILIVCDTPYNNVPRRWIGSAPATHAVGFSDGSTGLISPSEFKGLNRSSFAALDELFPEK